MYCGVSQKNTNWAFDYDHFIPTIAGGTNDQSNLVLCCHTCNQIKQKRIPPPLG
ncbi:MAG: HNH endonuclease [Bacteroidetes bacterium]|nr:HNH endonuclease [Bacteroidota bacterium]